jgi:hypothetical protein
MAQKYDRLYNNKSLLHKKQKDEVLPVMGIPIRSGIIAGNWLCKSCEGKTMGSNLFQPNCKECVKN